jgi:membrane protease subunit HflC
MPARPLNLLILIGAALVLVSSMAFTVNETQLALKFRFGEIVRSNYKPGLHFMIPLVNNVRKFERRIITQSYPSESFLTNEGKILNVDFYVKWRIKDANAYYNATGGIEDNASLRLGEIVKDSLKGVITRLTIQQVVASERAAVTGQLLEYAGPAFDKLGVELVDVRIRRIDLPEDVTDSVYQRMNQSFKAQANKLRSQGRAISDTTTAEAERERTEILATATKESERIRGEGDARAAEIYAQVHSRNPEFYAFYRSLQAYRKSLGTGDDVIVVSPDGEFFKYLKKSGGS